MSVSDKFYISFVFFTVIKSKRKKNNAILESYTKNLFFFFNKNNPQAKQLFKLLL